MLILSLSWLLKRSAWLWGLCESYVPQALFADRELVVCCSWVAEKVFSLKADKTACVALYRDVIENSVNDEQAALCAG